MTFAFDTGRLSDVGRVRQVNEDAALALPECGLWVVADGMGGHSAGDVAAGMVVDALASTGMAVGADDLVARVSDRLTQANDAIRAHAAAGGLGTIGATVVALLVAEDGARAVWSGDSRLYRLREGRLTLMTRDHTEVNALIDSGALTPEEAAGYPRRNVITRAIGVSEVPELEVREVAVEPGDMWLLCSDGLTEHVEDGDIQHLMAGATPQAACGALVALTLERGARDNVTVVAVGIARHQASDPVPEDVPLEGIIPDV